MATNETEHGPDHTEMTKDDAARVQSAADRNPDSASATSGFAQRAQSTADRAEHHQQR
jgi:hypothetical protein